MSADIFGEGIARRRDLHADALRALESQQLHQAAAIKQAEGRFAALDTVIDLIEHNGLWMTRQDAAAEA